MGYHNREAGALGDRGGTTGRGGDSKVCVCVWGGGDETVNKVSHTQQVIHSKNQRNSP